jgi:hypothetical protein
MHYTFPGLFKLYTRMPTVENTQNYCVVHVVSHAHIIDEPVVRSRVDVSAAVYVLIEIVEVHIS